ncbi:MAG: Mut7-C RNAse domain-containing protein, partial [Acidobacteriota bacterium]
MRFVVDCMLGSLAKWLKILGLDTRYDPALDDDDLVEIADRQDRILVTRDSRLVRRRRLREPIFIVSQDLHDQIRQVLRE